MQDILLEKGVHPESVKHAVESLVQTSLRGVDSHGINLFPHYCRAVDSGRINKNPDIHITVSAPSVAIVNADHAFGHHAGAVAINHAIQSAKETGIAAVNVKNSTHFGAAAYFALLAAKEDCIGFSFTNADALVKAFSSKEAFFGTNPVCFCAPMKNEEPLCLDMATSLVSWNKIKAYRRADKPIPEHWAFDANGDATTDPHKAVSLSPAGGYKGFGLGLMVDILCSILVNSPISKDILPMYSSPIESKRYIGHFFMVMDISKFIHVELFKETMQSMADRIRSLSKSNDKEKVMIPGDPEKIMFIERSRNGIPMEEIVFEEYLQIDKDFQSTILLS